MRRSLRERFCHFFEEARIAGQVNLSGFLERRTGVVAFLGRIAEILLAQLQDLGSCSAPLCEDANLKILSRGRSLCVTEGGV